MNVAQQKGGTIVWIAIVVIVVLGLWWLMQGTGSYEEDGGPIREVAEMKSDESIDAGSQARAAELAEMGGDGGSEVTDADRATVKNLAEQKAN